MPGTEEEVSALGGYAALVLVFADAVAQATPQQRARIEAEVMPLAEDLRESGITKAREVQLVRRITDALMSIMGSSWELSPETRQWVDGLLR